jgi:cobalt-zinc-cadmium efflux system outer membrane protein
MRNRSYCLSILLAALSLNALAQTALVPPADLLKEASDRPRLSLEDFEGFALAFNPTLQQARALTRASAGRATQASLLPNPTVGYQGEQIRGGAYGAGEQGAFVQQDIVLGGKLGLRKNAAEQQRRSDEIGAEEQLLRVRSGVAQSFYVALTAQEMVAVRRRLLDLAFDAVETAHGLANVGQADEPDVIEAEVEAEQAAVDYTAAQHQYLAKFRALTSVAGKPEMPLAALAGKLDTPPTLEVDHVIEAIVRDSPSVQRAKQDVLRAEAEWKAAKRESVPDLQLRGGLEENNELLELGQMHIVGVQGFASAGMTLPIFNRNQGNVAAAQAGLERARAEVTRLELALRQCATRLREDYLSRLSEAQLYRDQMIPRATRAYQLYLGKYRQMGAAYPQVLVSQRTLFQLQVSYLTVLEKLWVASIALQNDTLSGALDAPEATTWIK